MNEFHQNKNKFKKKTITHNMRSNSKYAYIQSLNSSVISNTAQQNLFEFTSYSHKEEFCSCVFS